MSIQGATREGSVYLLCDHCGRICVVPDPDVQMTLPEGWVEVAVVGWIGSFHGCCQLCRAAVATKFACPLIRR